MIKKRPHQISAIKPRFSRALKQMFLNILMTILPTFLNFKLYHCYGFVH